MPTVFSMIIAGDIPGRFVWKDDTVVAFTDINPVRPGHTLVVPRREIDQWTDLPADVAGHAMEVAHAVGNAVKAVYSPTRIGLLVAGFDVPHTHLHVLAIDDMGDFKLGSGSDPGPVALDNSAENIRAALRELGHAAAVDAASAP